MSGFLRPAFPRRTLRSSAAHTIRLEGRLARCNYKNKPVLPAHFLGRGTF